MCGYGTAKSREKEATAKGLRGWEKSGEKFVTRFPVEAQENGLMAGLRPMIGREWRLLKIRVPDNDAKLVCPSFPRGPLTCSFRHARDL